MGSSLPLSCFVLNPLPDDTRCRLSFLSLTDLYNSHIKLDPHPATPTTRWGWQVRAHRGAHLTTSAHSTTWARASNMDPSRATASKAATAVAAAAAAAAPPFQVEGGAAVAMTTAVSAT